MNVYREPLRVDTTDLELARIREAEQTKRHVHSWECWWRVEQRRQWFRWYSASAAPSAVFAVGSIALILTGCALTIMYCAHLWF